MEDGTKPSEDGRAGAVVVAEDVTRRYGEGDTAVDALRGVSLEVGNGKLTAVMGPSGSGKSTLMHILAGLDKPTTGSVSVSGTEITTLKDSDLTKLRRRHIGFVFQFFNLLPMLTAEENILLPLSIAGEKVGSRVVPRPRRQGRPRRPAAATARPSSRVASSSGSRSRGRSSRGRPCSSPTSRPATSTRPPARRS